MNTAARRQERAPYLDRLQDQVLFREFAYINGEWCAGDNGEVVPVSNPADGSWIGSVANISQSQSRAAVEAAQAAFTHWSAKLPQERSVILRRWFELMLQHKHDLALLMTLEQGKPWSESLGEIEYAASFIEFFAEEAKRRAEQRMTEKYEPGFDAARAEATLQRALARMKVVERHRKRRRRL